MKRYRYLISGLFTAFILTLYLFFPAFNGRIAQNCHYNALFFSSLPLAASQCKARQYDDKLLISLRSDFGQKKEVCLNLPKTTKTQGLRFSQKSRCYYPLETLQSEKQYSVIYINHINRGQVLPLSTIQNLKIIGYAPKGYGSQTGLHRHYKQKFLRDISLFKKMFFDIKTLNPVKIQQREFVQKITALKKKHNFKQNKASIDKRITSFLSSKHWRDMQALFRRGEINKPPDRYYHIKVFDSDHQLEMIAGCWIPPKKIQKYWAQGFCHLYGIFNVNFLLFTELKLEQNYNNQESFLKKELHHLKLILNTKFTLLK